LAAIEEGGGSRWRRAGEATGAGGPGGGREMAAGRRVVEVSPPHLTALPKGCEGLGADAGTVTREEGGEGLV